MDKIQLAEFIKECEIACELVQDRVDYSFTPAKARAARIGAGAVLKEIKSRLGVIDGQNDSL